MNAVFGFSRTDNLDLDLKRAASTVVRCGCGYINGVLGSGFNNVAAHNAAQAFDGETLGKVLESTRAPQCFSDPEALKAFQETVTAAAILTAYKAGDRPTVIDILGKAQKRNIFDGVKPHGIVFSRPN